jgi:hypothetical protein
VRAILSAAFAVEHHFCAREAETGGDAVVRAVRRGVDRNAILIMSDLSLRAVFAKQSPGR